MLEIEGLVAGHAGREVARLGALRLAPGECGLLIGPSGSGKTTLLLAIAGLADVLAGSVTLDGAELTSLSPARRDILRGRTIGLIFQDLHLIPGLSVLDNVLLAPFAAGIPQNREQALSLLDELGLAGHAHRRAETLSRGEAQRVAIARAMLLEPTLILADEPTASLDEDTCARVAGLLIRAAEKTGAAMVIATHDLRLKTRFQTIVDLKP